MKVTLVNSVIFAENYEKLIKWYMDTFDLEITSKTEEDYNYTDLGQSGRTYIGIAKAEEMGAKPTTPRNNSVIIQLSVSDISELFDKVKNSEGKILFGPSVEKKEGFRYGGLEDIEGNQIWVIEKF